MKQISPCPTCKSGILTKSKTFQMQTEAIHNVPSTLITVDMMKCERCNATFPAMRGKKKYTLVPGRKLTELLHEEKELEEKNQEMEKRIGEMERRHVELGEEVDKSKVRGEIGLLEREIESLESDMSALERGRKRIEEVVNEMAFRSHLADGGLSRAEHQ